jgi:hypothetical protein
MAYNFICQLRRNWSSTIIWRLRIWSHGFWWFLSYQRGRGGVIVPVVPLKIIEPIDDCQLVVKCSTSGSTPSAPPRPQPQVKKNKRSISTRETKSISTRETRSKSVKPAANTRSKSKIWIWTLRVSRSLKTLKICIKIFVLSYCENLSVVTILLGLWYLISIKFEFESIFEFEPKIEFEPKFEYMPKLKLNQHMRSIALCYVFDRTFEFQCLKMIIPNEKCARNKLES